MKNNFVGFLIKVFVFMTLLFSLIMSSMALSSYVEMMGWLTEHGETNISNVQGSVVAYSILVAFLSLSIMLMVLILSLQIKTFIGRRRSPKLKEINKA